MKTTWPSLSALFYGVRGPNRDFTPAILHSSFCGSRKMRFTFRTTRQTLFPRDTRETPIACVNNDINLIQWMIIRGFPFVVKLLAA